VPAYGLKSGVVGVERSASGMHITNIVTGTILQIPDTDREVGMIEIVYQGRNVSVFLQDVRERSERADGREHRSMGAAGSGTC
jgi:hypothetical protein